MLAKVIILCFLSAFTTAEKVRYKNYALYKVHPHDEDSLQVLKDLQDSDKGLDFWKPPTAVGDFVSVVSPPELRSEFEDSLAEKGIYSQLMLENIQEAFDAQLYSRRKRETGNQMHWTNYQTLDDLLEWFDALAQAYPNIVTVVTAGQTHEGRNITGIRISRDSGRRAFFLEGGQVAADWLSPTVVAYIADQLVRGEDPEALAASEHFDWHIFPVSNPDGHEFTQNSVRLWIKNRRPIDSNAIGVDLTRNWNSQWGVRGGSFTPSNNNFIGIGPFSEAETRSLAEYIESIGTNLIGLLSFRSFGQRLVIPFAHTADHIYNYDEMVTIGRRAMGSLAVRYGTQYLVGNSMEVFDGATGVIADWTKHRFNPPVVATFHLRDTGGWGYTLPVAQVEPSCQETYDSVMAIIREAKLLDVL